MVGLTRHTLWVAIGIAAAGWLGQVAAPDAVAAANPLKGTIVDRQGNRHEVDKLTYNGRLNLQYYVEGRRRAVPLARIKRLRFAGDQSDEEQALVVTLRSGAVEHGTIVTGASTAPHQDAVGGGGTTPRFAGSTPLGPFFILAHDVREVIMVDTGVQAPREQIVLRAIVITVDGKRFDVTDLKCRGDRRLHYYSQGDRRRYVDLAKVSVIDFAEGSAHLERRPVTITYWSGKVVQGTVEAGRVRLSGETDRSYYERVYAAWSGKIDQAVFALGMHQVEQVRFKQEAGEKQEADEPDETGCSAGGRAPEE